MDTSAIFRVKALYSGVEALFTSAMPAIADRSTAKQSADPFSCLALDLYSDLMRSEHDLLAAGVDRKKLNLALDRYAKLTPSIRSELLSFPIYIERYPALEEVEADVLKIMSEAIDERQQGYLSSMLKVRASRILAIRKIFDSLTTIHTLLQELFVTVVDIRDSKERSAQPWIGSNILDLFPDLVKVRDNVFLDYSPVTLKSYYDSVRLTLERKDLRSTIESQGGAAAWELYQTKIEQIMTDIEIEMLLDQSLTA